MLNTTVTVGSVEVDETEVAPKGNIDTEITGVSASPVAADQNHIDAGEESDCSNYCQNTESPTIINFQEVNNGWAEIQEEAMKEAP